MPRVGAERADARNAVAEPLGSLIATVIETVGKLRAARQLPAEHRILHERFRRIGWTRLQFGEVAGNAAFDVTDGGRTITFNLQVAERLWGRVLLWSSDDEEVNPSAVFTRILLLFILHELAHIPQGLASIRDVRALKAIEQDDLIAEFDFMADVEAAKLFALNHCLEASDFSPVAFESGFKQALYLHVHSCLPLFGFRRSAPFKMGRAIGLVLMLARASLIEVQRFAGKSVSNLRPLMDGLLVRPNQDFSETSVRWTGENWALAVLECDYDDGWMARIARAVEAEDTELAIRIATEYLISRPQYWGR